MFLSRLIGGPSPRAATPENPSFNLNDEAAWDAFTGGTTSATGKVVSPDKALTWSAWWRGVTLLSRMLAKAPCCVFKTDPRGEYGATHDLAHPAYKLLRHKPNDYQTAFQFKLALAGHAINRGNGYAAIFRAGPNPTELLLLDPDDTEPVVEGGRVWYANEPAFGKRLIPASDVFHLRGFGFDGVRGYPLWEMAKECIGLGLTFEAYRGVRYKNSARPSVVLTTDAKLDAKAPARLRSEWERMHGGLDNQYKTAVLDNGLKATTLSFSPDEMQDVESAGLPLRDAANFLGIPSSKLGDVAGVKYASKEQDDRNLLEDGVDFWLCAFEAEAWDKLLLESEKEDHTRLVSFDRDALLSFDLTTKANYYRTATGGRGWMSPAEVREREHLEPRDEPDIDTILTPLNMGQGGADNRPEDLSDDEPGRPTEEDGGGEEVPAGNAAARGAAETALTHAARKMVKRAAFHANRASADVGKYMDFVGSIRDQHAAVFRAEFQAAEEMARAVNRDGLPREGEAAGWLIEKLCQEYAHLADTQTAKGLPSAVKLLATGQEVRLPKDVVCIFLG